MRDLTIVINGHPMNVTVSDQPLKQIRNCALTAAKYDNIPLEKWELMDKYGTVLDENLKLDNVELSQDLLFICLKAGTGG